MKDNPSQEKNGKVIFSVYMYKCYKYYITLLKKNERWCSPEIIYLKEIDILDHILERVPMILCTFMKNFIGVFIYCFPGKKKQKKQQETNKKYNLYKNIT